MGSDVPENAPPDAQVLVDWGTENAEQVGVSSVEEQGLLEVNLAFSDASLLVAGTLGRGQTPPLWETASLIRSRDVETNTAIQFPRQMDAAPIVYDEDEETLTLRTANAELSLTPNPGGSEGTEESGGEDE